MIRSLVPLRSFLAVVRAGGIRRAAVLLSYAPTTVTAHIHRLERVLGVQLLDRSDDRRLVTREAEQLLPHMEKAESAVTELEQTAEALSDWRDRHK